MTRDMTKEWPEDGRVLPSGNVVHHNAIGTFKVASKWAVRIPESTAQFLGIRQLVPLEFRTKKAAHEWMETALTLARREPAYVSGSVFADQAVRDLERTLVLEATGHRRRAFGA